MSDAREDVYESEDLPEAERNNFEHDSNDSNDPEHFELIHLDIDAAKKRFEGRTLNCRGVDFSDSIAKKRQRAYGSSAYVLEVVGKGFEEPETPEQKFNRITYELNELSDQLQNKTIEPSGLLNEPSVAQLIDEVKGVRINKQPSSSDTTSTPVDQKQSSASKVEGDAKIIPLEQRLRKLELLVGPVDGSKQPLMDALEDLKFRTEALNPTYVEGLEARLHQVLTKLDQVDDKREKSGEGDLEEKVNELLALMSKWDASCGALPSNVKKIQALHRLHEQAQHFSERLSQLVGIRDQVEKAVSAEKETMRDLQARMKQDVGGILKQIASVEQRLNSISK